MVAPTAIDCVAIWPGLPSISPGKALIAVVAKTPVARAPKTPPTPWTENTSSASSMRSRSRRTVALYHWAPLAQERRAVAQPADGETDDDRAAGGDEARRRGDGDQAGDGTARRADDAD